MYVMSCGNMEAHNTHEWDDIHGVKWLCLGNRRISKKQAV